MATCAEWAEAFTIFAKYTDDTYPTHAEHDVLYVHVDGEKVSEEDKEKLAQLGFNYYESDESFSIFT